jgi:riboflavin synthase alpha subunit
VSPETLGRTTLAAKADGRGWVNLEPALRLADRLGGHLVSGHVDGLGVVKSITQVAGSWRLELQWRERSYGRFICDKASVAVDGISLTVAGCEPGGGCFWIAVIPHTWGATTLQHLRPGSLVNLEADLLAKYTETLLLAKGSAGGGSGGPEAEAGMICVWDGKIKNWVVAYVVKGGPAEKVGVKRGDLFMGFGNEDAGNIGFARMRKRFEGQENEELKLTLSRKGELYRTTVKLSPLVTVP